MLALYSSLVPLAFSSIAWPSGVGMGLGLLTGGGLAYLLADGVLRAQGRSPQRGLVRRLAAVCCLAWGLVLPLGLTSAGLVWGVGFGVGSLVEGPVSTTVRQTVHATVAAANGVGAAVLGRLPLAKRLSERELLTIVQAAPAWISAALDADRIQSLWQQATGGPMPPQLMPVLRHELGALTSHHREWLHPAVETLRARAQGSAGSWPTVQEAIEATVAPSVFHGASVAIGATTRRDAALLAFSALALSALLAGALRLLWRGHLRAASVVASAAAVSPVPDREEVARG